LISQLFSTGTLAQIESTIKTQFGTLLRKRSQISAIVKSSCSAVDAAAETGDKIR
jgi:hypothetical protein